MFLVWGAPGLPDTHGDHQGVDGLRTKRVRIAVALMSVASLLVLAGSVAPAALGASKYRLRFVDPDGPGPASFQPQDAEVGDTIKASDLNDAAAFVQVELVDAAGNRVATSKGPVSFTLATGEIPTGGDYASGPLHVTPQPLINGLATFGEGTLSIGTVNEPEFAVNEPQFTDYALVPITTKGTFITGDASEGFDIWEDGESCTGGGDLCEASLRDGEDDYSLNAAGTLGVSELSGALPGLVCDGQDEIFTNTIFSYATTGGTTPVFLSNHITKEDWQASANNGQAHADWCIGLVHESDWDNSGADPTQMDTDLDGDLDLWVALAPRCPVANPSGSAPCIVSQTADGLGGSTTFGWLPGGDPPRRT
jgi:hypothetical protein